MSDSENNCDCTVFDEGDWVESRLNASIFGIVVGEADFGRFYHVQLASSLEIRTFYAVTLQHMDMPQEPPDAAEHPLPDNVVQVDFTKKRRLRPDTTTEGAA
ncbi:hypothetical protein EVB67_038 [Rhizobium phage RHph_TM3_3_14B]|nr:hypothetical protein EVB67_038 [Rhizobium phage RHph_TM3_3_14B]